MNQIKNNILSFFISILSISNRDIRIQLRNINDIISILTFFAIATLIFIFAIGPNEEQLKIISASILWSILTLSTSIAVNKALKDDYEDGNLGIYQFVGLSLSSLREIDRRYLPRCQGQHITRRHEGQAQICDL